jgi:RHH-type transcriptional regulator, proline utilization regulon repressor / proline dehydrogenase / delta 1-pyrroline-5-carboxylate dehydrogenase
MGGPATPNPREGRIQTIGRELFDRVRGEAQAAFRGDRWTAGLIEWALAHEDAKLQLFRFIDVLPALRDDVAVVRHLQEYFSAEDNPFGTAARLGLKVARAGWLGQKVLAIALRRIVRQFAHRFIAGSTPADADRAIRRARAARQTATLDLLGEACVSEPEAAEYQRRYLDLLAHLAPAAEHWPAYPQLDQASWGPVPRVNVSVKLSALSPRFDPIDPAGSAAAVKARLRPILEAAHRHGAHIHIDMEDRQLTALTFQVFRELGEEPAFRDTRRLGIVLQAYLRDAEVDAEKLVAWAGQRGTPCAVRLVKGAYWDYETARARLEGWPVPVYESKGETDACFERLTRYFLEHAERVDLALGSHNIRSIAHALAWREHLGLPQNALEFQLLYGMAGPLATALAERGERVRIYMPIGELIPGMSYLVRRLLENTSNESFLRRGFGAGASPAVLLAPPNSSGGGDRGSGRGGAGDEEAPGRRGEEARGRGGEEAREAPGRRSVGARGGSGEGGSQSDVRAGDEGEFRNTPRADFADAEERLRLERALAHVRGQFGGYYPLLIAGERVETAESIVSVNPARPDAVVGRTACATVADLDRAVAAARRAFPDWRALGAPARARLLQRAARLMRERRADLTAWIILEAGKPWREADGDVAEAVDFLEYYSREAVRLQAPQRLGALPGEINEYRREPRGVVGVIAPWNFPLAILTGMSSAALATGNTVVMKPAQATSVIAAQLAAILVEAGLPPGVVNYLPGPGGMLGERLARHPDVTMIAFTGSREVGVHLYATAAELPPGAWHLKRVVAELGGKNAIVVDDDADLDEATQGIVLSAFGYAGQKCSACSRVIAVGGIYDRLLERLVEAVRTLPFGPADHPATVVGPVIDAGAQKKVQGYLETGAEEARPALRREVPPALVQSGGYYVPPAIFAEVPPDSRLAREEIFGPVLSALRAADFEQALQLAMESEYALTGGVFSRSPGHLALAEERFRVGDLYLNRGITGAIVGRQPFGGRQLSGVGYQAGGPDYLLQFLETRTISENTLRRGFASGRLTEPS